MQTQALEIAIESAELGNIAAYEPGQFVAAHAGLGGSLVQMHADGSYDVDGDPAEGGTIPLQFLDRVKALLGDPDAA